MVGKEKACVECSRKCFVRHYRRIKNSKPLVSSFFKVMIGDGFSNVLFFPPAFAPTVSALIGEEILLEDLNGLKWKAKVTMVEGISALQKGWDLFATDHGLEVGDFLVFHYMEGSHFMVQIYGRSSCEKLDFPKGRTGNRRLGANRNSNDQGGPSHSADRDSFGSVEEVGSSQCAEGRNGPQTRKEEMIINMVDDDDQINYDQVDEVSNSKSLAIAVLPTTISCFVSADNQSFLELPTALPEFCYNNRKVVKEKKVALLRDPDMRLWPVLYQETSQLHRLISGWEAFSLANNIRPGDLCDFEQEDLVEGIFRVAIARN